jgi:hypothetical protein
MTQVIEPTTASARQYEPYHGVHDEDKLATLIGNMVLNGWQGAPVVADGDCLITGSHRWHAVKQIERMYEADKTDTEVLLHVVDIRDIYPEFDDLMDEFDNPVVGEPMYAMAIDSLPADIRDAYGIDMQ